MQQTIERESASLLRLIPRELVTVVVVAAAIFAVVALGSLIASALPSDVNSPWLVIASYAAPAAVAFLIYWWTDQRH